MLSECGIDVTCTRELTVSSLLAHKVVVWSKTAPITRKDLRTVLQFTGPGSGQLSPAVQVEIRKPVTCSMFGLSLHEMEDQLSEHTMSGRTSLGG